MDPLETQDIERDYLHRIFMVRLNKHENPVCPGCHNPALENYAPTQDRKVYYCRKCLRTIAPLAGTIFSKTKIPIQQWLQIAKQIILNGSHIQAKELSIDFNISMRTSYRVMLKVSRWQKEHKIPRRKRRKPEDRRYSTGTFLLFEMILKTMPPLFNNKYKTHESRYVS